MGAAWRMVGLLVCMYQQAEKVNRSIEGIH